VLQDDKRAGTLDGVVDTQPPMGDKRHSGDLKKSHGKAATFTKPYRRLQRAPPTIVDAVGAPRKCAARQFLASINLAARWFVAG
jgi:hypothetical protein